MIIGWGCPRQFLRKIGDASNKIIEIYKPVEGSTQMTTTKGEKKEAKVEGGENEAVKYAKNTYALATTIRIGNEDGTLRKKIVPDSDGVVDGEYEYWLCPEDPKAPWMHMERCTVSVEDGWTAEDGTTLVYTMDAVKAEGHDQVEWGTGTLTGVTEGQTGYMQPVASIEFKEAIEPEAEA